MRRREREIYKPVQSSILPAEDNAWKRPHKTHFADTGSYHEQTSIVSYVLLPKLFVIFIAFWCVMNNVTYSRHGYFWCFNQPIVGALPAWTSDDTAQTFFGFFVTLRTPASEQFSIVGSACNWIPDLSRYQCRVPIPGLYVQRARKRKRFHRAWYQNKERKASFFGEWVDNVRLRCLLQAGGAFDRSKSIMTGSLLMSLGPSSLCIDEHLVVVIKKI